MSVLSSQHLIGNWKSLLEEKESVHLHSSAHEIQNPRYFRRTKDTTLTSSHLFWHDPWGANQSVTCIPHGTQDDPLCGDTLKTCPTAPATGLSLYPMDKMLHKHFVEAERGHVYSTIWPLSHLWYCGGPASFPSFLVFFPL